ncbi:DUF6544 family protein [Dyadobacter sp. CY312]|uniref:DUF6544 family protein n=1 Tax=Dyadobacter sp. CY312 TaxID=2907303 RepID=UPI001F39FB0F|nr:DUF6544 family protein [Dyadobacter sp. CY312]MCE7043790.1 hypothetical protein [Dyadobacter sp. CY312]
MIKRYYFPVLILIHGMLHLTGFLSEFELVDVMQFRQTFPKPFNNLWLIAGLLFAFTAFLLAFRNRRWWLCGIVAVAFSQVLVIVFWQEAKFATIPNVVILVAALTAAAACFFKRKFDRDVKTGLQQKAYFGDSLLTETDISQLPDPVKKYIRFAGCMGKAKVNNFRVEFTGKLRKDEQSAWMPFTSEQYNFMHTPTRLFFMKAWMKNLPVAGYHCFLDGRASMDIRLFSLFKVQYQDGPEMDLSETVTFFNDMCCLAPATLIDKRITWLEVLDGNVRASFTNNHLTVSAWLHFNEAGALVNFISLDRYAADTGTQLPWATPLKDYQEINGFNLMRDAETIYSYPDRDLCYGTFRLDGVKYNCIIKDL